MSIMSLTPKHLQITSASSPWEMHIQLYTWCQFIPSYQHYAYGANITSMNNTLSLGFLCFCNEQFFADSAKALARCTATWTKYPLTIPGHYALHTSTDLLFSFNSNYTLFSEMEGGIPMPNNVTEELFPLMRVP